MINFGPVLYGAGKSSSRKDTVHYRTENCIVIDGVMLNARLAARSSVKQVNLITSHAHQHLPSSFAFSAYKRLAFHAA